MLAREQLDNLRLQQMIKETWTLSNLAKLTEHEKRSLFQALSTDFGIKYDKERLERGKSTEIFTYVKVDLEQFRPQKTIDITPEKDEES